LPGLAPAERWRALALLGRLLLGQGRTREARDATAPELARLGEGEGTPILEVAGLAALYAGALEEADRIFARGEQALAAGPPSQLARFVSLRGMVATSAERPVEASALYRRALALVEGGGDPHGRATYRANLASTLIELGELGEALERLTGAVSDLERLARTGELAGARCNLANLYLLLGDTAAAGRQLALARELAERLGSRKVLAFVEQLEGDRARVAREPQRALERYRTALAGLEEVGTPRERALCELSRVDALAEAGRLAEARAALAARPLEGEGEAELRGATAASWARLHLAGGGGLPDACLALLASHCAELERRGLRKDLWRAAALLGRALRAAGERAAARAALGRARQSWEGIVHATPESHRALFTADPEAKALESEWAALGEEPPAASPPAPDRDEVARTRRLLAINKRLNSELRLPRLLEAIMDTVIELTEAERGFLLLSRKDGTLAVKVARNIDKRSLEGEELALSRSIAERAARASAPIVTVDALSDGRFQQALSVSDLHLRSVLAVPLSVKGRVVGTVYIDNRLRGGVFGEAEVRLVQDIADQAAIAIENARLLAANRRKRRLIQRLNRALARKLESQQAELLEVREELRSNKEALQSRGRGAIVGRSPRMRELFQLLDRVTETELPVVVLGESGTGKELVARAIHLDGPRASRPFVSENCAAIPETLLESILFGHVRGAFTGADRDRKGLFEVASRGTLFLDEVGEMSAAMQTKLLRVLQDGELRRVGGAQTIRTDVRVIAASNKDLAELVASGRFREDLFYRLNVIQVKIPALRERREDIPLLCDHFLEKHAGGQGRRLSPDALARLSGHAWPGNVRELENEIMRAAALAGRVIQVRDLSPAIAGSAPLALARGSDLQLRPRVEHLERELIAQSLRLAAGNHTQAARSLGLSRFGLLKKIRRYGLG
jgi:transcriptional regulator with GAF, ATPase, and Fis domain